MILLSTLLNHFEVAYLACFGRRSTGLNLHLRPYLPRGGAVRSIVLLLHVVLCEIGRYNFVTLSQLQLSTSVYCPADYCEHKAPCLRGIRMLYTPQETLLKSRCCSSQLAKRTSHKPINPRISYLVQFTAQPIMDACARYLCIFIIR